MKNWLCVLVAPRPTFQFDMTDEERELMREHVRYWRTQVSSAKALVFGPVIHPKAEFGGIAILALEDDEDPNDYSLGDPVIRADAGFRFEAFWMPQLVQSESS